MLKALAGVKLVHKKAQQLRIEQANIKLIPKFLKFYHKLFGQAGFQPGIDVGISIDFAASALKSKNGYHLKGTPTPYSRDELSGLLV